MSNKNYLDEINNINGNKKIKDWFTDNIFYFLLVIFVGIWILRGILTLEETGKTIQQIITDSALFLIFSIVISQLFNFQGIVNGMHSQDVTNVKKVHETAITAVEPYGNEIEQFCERKNKENLRTVRTRLLLGVGLAYTKLFDDDGVAKDAIFDASKIKLIPKKYKKRFGKNKGKILTKYVKDKKALKYLKEREQTYHKALRLKLTPLTPANLISDNAKKNDTFNFGQKLEDYVAKSSASGMTGQIITAVIFGYYGIGLVQNFSLWALIWATFQTVMFLIFGFWKYFRAYLYMQNGYVFRIEKQNHYLLEFKNYCVINNIKKAGIDTTEDELIKKVTDKVTAQFEVVK